MDSTDDSFGATPPSAPGPLKLPRRHALALVAFVLWHPRVLLAGDASEVDVRPDILRVFVDRLIPAHGAHPGARALGIDATVLAHIQAKKSGSAWLTLIGRELGGSAFLKYTPEEQNAKIAEVLRAGSPVATMFHALLDHAVTLYFVKPEAWVPLGYRTPQPLGYPDYAECTGHGSQGDAG